MTDMDAVYQRIARERRKAERRGVLITLLLFVPPALFVVVSALAAWLKGA
jgi:hypothetical protein